MMPLPAEELSAQPTEGARLQSETLRNPSCFVALQHGA